MAEQTMQRPMCKTTHADMYLRVRCPSRVRTLSTRCPSLLARAFCKPTLARTGYYACTSLCTQLALSACDYVNCLKAHKSCPPSSHIELILGNIAHNLAHSPLSTPMCYDHPAKTTLVLACLGLLTWWCVALYVLHLRPVS